ncbi:alginate lyase family protein [Runella aurantiaca]|uniref:Alginate lyase n=1 Tax=Runella aurantiaca TaxID=2282308 RepID=A0A369I8D6_9BACT|nr:alginate lyase family protein [Runella aurantiaca]RDB02936.1 alginate lyase [Runella aurantiaca]
MTQVNKLLQITLWLLWAVAAVGQPQKPNNLRSVITETLQKSTLKQADWAMSQSPVTITAEQCERSAGGLHDFYSEGDYWWKNPDDPNGPYIQRDGQSNPDNFTAHRKAMVRFSQIIGSLASAYLMTHNEMYVKQAFVHLKAWFVDEKTYMNPSLLYAQAIKGRATGRGIGIIDMIQMMEVAQGIRVMENAKSVNSTDLQRIKNWFSNYLSWITTHQYGIDEREAKNNHGTCWVMQVAVFAKLVENQALIDFCKTRFKTILLPSQLEKGGSFPLELKRTKPYGYSLFNLDAMTTVCHVLSDDKEDLWDYTLTDGRTLRKAIEFMYPFVENKSTWTYPKDVMYWDEWPVAQPFLLFGYQKYRTEPWLKTWTKLEHFPTTEEVIRNLPVRNPLIWVQ